MGASITVVGGSKWKGTMVNGRVTGQRGSSKESRVSSKERRGRGISQGAPCAEGRGWPGLHPGRLTSSSLQLAGLGLRVGAGLCQAAEWTRRAGGEGRKWRL